MMNNKGFTIAELVVAALIFGIVGAGLVASSITARKVHERESSVLQLQQHGRLAVNSMVSELRAATNVTIHNSSSLIFSTPNLTNVNFFYNSTSKQIIREYPSGTQKVLGNDVSALEFAFASASDEGDEEGEHHHHHSDNSALEIQVRTSKDYRGGTINFPTPGNLKVRVGLRNGTADEEDNSDDEAEEEDDGDYDGHHDDEDDDDDHGHHDDDDDDHGGHDDDHGGGH